MKENVPLEKMKHFAKRIREDFCAWFNEKEHPQSRLNKNVFFHDLLKIICLILVFLIIHYNVDKLNQIVLIFIKIGSLLQLILLLFVLRKAWHLILNLKYAYRGLSHGVKAVIAMIIIVLLFIALQNQNSVVDLITGSYEKVEFQKFNPIKISLNLSAVNITLPKTNPNQSVTTPKGMIKNPNACPQMNISGELWGNIIGVKYEGWTIKSGTGGSPGCRKGSKEGENIHYYYCGGYGSSLLGGVVNAYVEKTVVSNNGEIGKTYKHVIWNIYDEHKNFVETKCLGDPDEFEKKQIEAFENELLKWK